VDWYSRIDAKAESKNRVREQFVLAWSISLGPKYVQAAISTRSVQYSSMVVYCTDDCACARCSRALHSCGLDAAYSAATYTQLPHLWLIIMTSGAALSANRVRFALETLYYPSLLAHRWSEEADRERALCVQMQKRVVLSGPRSKGGRVPCSPLLGLDPPPVGSFMCAVG